MPRWSCWCEVMPWEKRHHLLQILKHITYLCWGQHLFSSNSSSSSHRQLPPTACLLAVLVQGTSCGTKALHREAWTVLHHACQGVCNYFGCCCLVYVLCCVWDVNTQSMLLLYHVPSLEGYRHISWSSVPVMFLFG